MTCMLARLDDPADATVAAQNGVDAIEVWMDSAGAAVDPDRIRAIRGAFPRTLRLRFGSGHQPGAIEAAVSFGADEIAVPREAVAEAAAILNGLAPLVRPVAIVATLCAVTEMTAPSGLAAAQSIAIDVQDGVRLIDAIAIDRLDRFARACRAAHVPFGLSGALEAPDVARLLLLRPDVLGFDIALRRGYQRKAPFEAGAVAAIRALIRRDAAGRPRDAAVDSEDTDRVFVHDFVALLSIGAYQAERGVRQRVRFSVDAAVRAAKPPADMNGVFSYDIIIETIRVLAARTHVTFVETLAEDLAAMLLTHDQLRAVEVKVEKLDVIEGSVGVLIRRDRRGMRPA